MTTKIHSITRTKVFSQFMHAFTYGVSVTKVSRLRTFEPDPILGLRLFISYGLKPIGQRLFTLFGSVSEHFDHGDDVSYKLQHAKAI